MYIIDYLLKNFGKDERATKILKRYGIRDSPRVSRRGRGIPYDTGDTKVCAEPTRILTPKKRKGSILRT